MDALIKAPEILTNVKQMLRLHNTDNDRWLKALIQQGARDLNSPETLIIKNCFITVNDNKFYLPDDCKTLLAIRCKNSCVNAVFVDTDFFNSCGCSGNFNGLRKFVSINGRWVIFHNNWYGAWNPNLSVDQNMYPNQCCDDHTVEIAYRAIDTDCDGDVVINEEAYTHLSMYAAYWFSLSYTENYTPEQRRAWSAHASAQGGRVRSAAARRKFEQQKAQIRDLMTTVVINNAPFGGLSGIYPGFYYSTYNSLP